MKKGGHRSHLSKFYLQANRNNC